MTTPVPPARPHADPEPIPPVTPVAPPTDEVSIRRQRRFHLLCLVLSAVAVYPLLVPLGVGLVLGFVSEGPLRWAEAKLKIKRPLGRWALAAGFETLVVLAFVIPVGLAIYTAIREVLSLVGDHRSDLVRIATQVMLERGLQPEFSDRVELQLASIQGAPVDHDPAIHDLRHLLWCSIDNDDSLDLDQLTVCEPLPSGAIRLWVAIADVDALVKKDTPIDAHALLNTTSVYTSARIFPMLPDRLCTDLTSLNPAEDRLALVTEMVFNADASLAGSTVYRARVHNRAKLAYDAVSAWIVGEGELPAAALSHPNIVTLTDYSVSDGRPYLVMELLDGDDLAEHDGLLSEPRGSGR